MVVRGQLHAPTALLRRGFTSHWIRGCVDHRAYLNGVTKMKFRHCWESNPRRPASRIVNTLIEIQLHIEEWLRTGKFCSNHSWPALMLFRNSLGPPEETHQQPNLVRTSSGLSRFQPDTDGMRNGLPLDHRLDHWF
jgi:hypothetical protein